MITFRNRDRDRVARPAATPLRLHAETTSDPNRVRWVLPPEHVRASGLVTLENVASAQLPTELVAALKSGDLREIHLTSDGVTCLKSRGAEWSELAVRINSALFDFLTAGNSLAANAPSVDDAALADGVAAVLAGEVGDYAASHGGAISLVDVHDGVVTLRLAGACRGCPAAHSTITTGIAAQVSRDMPGSAEFRVVD